MLWLDAHPDFNTPETTRSGSLGGMPVAVATGRALRIMRLDAKLDPPLPDEHVDMDVLDPREVMGHGNKVPNGPSSEELAKRFEASEPVRERLSVGAHRLYSAHVSSGSGSGMTPHCGVGCGVAS